MPQCSGFGPQHARPQQARNKTCLPRELDFLRVESAFRSDQQADGWIAHRDVERSRQQCLQAARIGVRFQQQFQLGAVPAIAAERVDALPSIGRVATALLAGASEHALPVPVLAQGSRLIQQHTAANRGDRRHSSDSQFRRLLQDQVHLLAAGDALKQCYLKW